ncbi:uncharacterized protein PGTG_01833 [Puccinia graminis f. sp. tritici CRL 75-36-700-3]|uniref:Uncharacterized protein n=1 Tax=Puccinia graminis f. sp. tritici (strain CRL 75-36-700-3 / race SCCL) TaxID=418459 RepID=E3JT13_PUCGT|nr:uncharacterized protein PGTG_01833 [Puccinia graminis f. sp. tritici CRL 75-36-700-3]EFP75240.2 hypothetical protein PGTG_01833 [Puccinia graminis f. sp. tritici CRL 75-36-700-3]
MEIFRAEQEQARLRRKQEREMAKLVKNQQKQAQKQAKEAENRPKKPVRDQISEMDQDRQDQAARRTLTIEASNSCIEISKTSAFDVFAVWMNNTNPDLLLNGRRLQLRIDRYKKKYLDAKRFEENTGAGIENDHGPQTLAEALERICPCFDRLDAILRDKANVVAMLEFDHSQPGLEPPPLEEESDAEGDLPAGQPSEVGATSNQVEGPSVSESPNLLSPDNFTDSLPNSTPISRSMSLATSSLNPPNQSAQGETGDTQSSNDHSNLPTTPTPSGPNGGGRQSGRGRQTPLGRSSQMASISAGSTSNAPQQAPKVSLATAFSSSADSRFAIIERQIQIEQERLRLEDAREESKEKREVSRVEREDERWKRQLDWERERYGRDEKRADEKESRQVALRNEKKSVIMDLVKQGRTQSEIEAYIRLIYD